MVKTNSIYWGQAEVSVPVLFSKVVDSGVDSGVFRFLQARFRGVVLGCQSLRSVVRNTDR